MTSPLMLRLRRSVSSWVLRGRRAFRAVWGRLVLLDQLVPLALRGQIRRCLDLRGQLGRLVRLGQQGRLGRLVRPGQKVTRVTLALRVLRVRLGRPARKAHKGQQVPQGRPALQGHKANRGQRVQPAPLALRCQALQTYPV